MQETELKAVKIHLKKSNEKLQEVTSNFLPSEVAFGYLTAAAFWIFELTF